MSTVLHISDTHFGTEQAAVVTALLQLHANEKPDLVIASGDITQRARRSQFHAATQFFSRLGTPALVIPGNHDIPLFNVVLRLLAPYANYSRAFGQELQPEFIAHDLCVIGVNTTRPHRHIDGEVSADQIRYVCERLACAHPAQLKIIVTHQPVLVVNPSDEINLLHGYREAIEAWVECGVDLILGGHIHLPYVRSLRSEGFAQPAWAVQAGTAISWRVRDNVPNSVNIIRYDQALRACCVEQWDYAAAHGAFHLALRTDLDLARD
ncbi:MAG: metallophosphoesterase [Spongiibacteraceae bacterium]